MKLSLIQIAKDEKRNLERLYMLVKDYIDEWIVVVPPKDEAISFLKDKATVIEQDFTFEVESELITKIRSYGLEIDDNYRLFKFAEARNASLKAATGDYILWLDADDIPKGLHNLKKFIELNPNTEVFDAVYDYYRDEEGNPISDHVRERVVINNRKFQWLGGEMGLIHETLLPNEGYQPLHLDIPDQIFRVEHQTDHVEASSLRNHIALLYEYLKTNGKDPRTTYYLGIEFFNRGMYENCIKILSEYVKVSGWDEERYNAYLKMAEAYHLLGDVESGRNVYLTALKELPNYPQAYLGLGESYHSTEDWGKCIEFTLTGLQKKLPSTKYILDKTRFTFRPAVYVALSYMQLGKPKDGYEWFIRAAKLNPNHPWIKEHAALFLEARDLDDFVKGFVKMGQIAQARYPKILPKLADSIPDELKGQELLMDFRWRYATPKIWNDKSVVFFCSSAFEDWGPESLIKGCGGSEEAIIQLTKRLVKLGWEVTVYNNCIKEGVVDGVRWVRYERFNPRDMFNIFVSWRNNMHDARTAVKKYVDMHDVPDLKHYTKEATEGLKLLVKSKFHRDCFPLEDDKFVIIPNGIDTEQFKNPKKTKNNLVWSSSYDRGLYFLLQMWPDIRKEVPDATLDIYYGFNLFDVTPWGKTKQGQLWKSQMTELMKQEGITEHGRVGTEAIAEAYKKADIWAYPTDFSEIDCITATKAMAAKAIPVTTDLAALKERNQGIMIKGSIHDEAVRRHFLDHLIALMKDDKQKSALRKKLNVAQYDWDNIAKQWDEEFKK